HRLSGIVLVVPPLRERVGDIEPLARTFVERAAGRLGRSAPPIAPAAMAALQGHGWPGNARELRNVMERALLLSGGLGIEVSHLTLPRSTRPPSQDQARSSDEGVPASSTAGP